MANFLFVLSSDVNEKATRCFQFAKIAHTKGHTVNIFLIDSGVEWAVNGKDGSQKTITGDCPNDYLPYLIESEIEVFKGTAIAQVRRLQPLRQIVGLPIGDFVL